MCLPLRRAGWRLVYDPQVAVDHDIAPRHDADTLHRGIFAEAPLRDAVHNETVELLEGRGPLSRAVVMTWALLVGTVENPGFAQCARRLLHRDPVALRAWRAAFLGRLAGAATARRRPRHLVIPARAGTDRVAFRRAVPWRNFRVSMSFSLAFIAHEVHRHGGQETCGGRSSRPRRAPRARDRHCLTV